MKCPFCESELQSYSVPSRLAQAASPVHAEDVVLDHCDTCKAVWFDRGELTLVTGVEVSRLPFVGNDDRVQPKCRACGADNVRGATVCEYCKAPLYVLCPRCSGRFFHTSVLHTPVDTYSSAGQRSGPQAFCGALAQIAMDCGASTRAVRASASQERAVLFDIERISTSVSESRASAVNSGFSPI